MFGQGFNSPQLHQRFEQTLARLDTKASRRTLSALAIPSSLRSSLRLKANQKTGSTAQVPLPFSLARPLPRSPLRSADGHRNRDAIVPRYLHISAFPIGNRYSVADSVRSLQLPSAPPRNGSRFICQLPFFFCVVTLWGVHPCCLPSSSRQAARSRATILPYRGVPQLGRSL